VDSFEELELLFLIERGKCSSLFPFKSCSFCETSDLDLTNLENFYKLTDDHYDHLKKSREFQRHIDIHIQNFSLLTFLKFDEGNNNLKINTMNVSQHQKIGMNLSSIALDFQHDLTQETISESRAQK
jgi:hypothetical protein